MTDVKDQKQEEFDQEMEQKRVSQNLPPGAVPEQRPIAPQTVDDPHSQVYKDLQKAGDDRAGVPAMDKEAYDRAASESQKRKAAKSEEVPERLYPGARGYVDNEGAPDHGRAIAVNAVHEWESETEMLKAAAGTPESRFARVKSYECVSRDGRAELLIISAEHIRRTLNEADWGKTPIS